MKKPRWSLRGVPLHQWVPTVYVVLGLLWIGGSDFALSWALPDDPRAVVWVSSVKGVAFVILTGLTFAVALRLAARERVVVPTGRSTAPGPRWRRLGVIILASALLVAMAAFSLLVQMQAVREGRERELRSAAALSAAQVAASVREQIFDVEQLGREPYLVRTIERWVEDGDVLAANALRTHLDSLGVARGYGGINVFTLEGAPLRQTAAAAHDVTEAALIRSVARSGAGRGIHAPRVAGRDPNRVPQLVVAAPVSSAASRNVLALAVIVVRAEVNDRLDGVLGPVPDIGATAATQLVHLERNLAIVVHSGSAGATDTDFELDPAPTRLGLFDARDSAGTDVLAVLVPVAGSDWYVLSTMDRAEAYAALNRATVAGAILLLAVFLLLATVIVRWNRLQERSLDDAIRAVADLRQHFLVATRYVNDTILLLDAERRIVDANDRARDVYGIEPADLIGRRVDELRAPRSAEQAQVAEQFNRILDESVLSFETMHQRGDGSLFPVEDSARRIDVGGRVFVQSAIRDISERREAEQALRSSEARYRSLFEQAVDGIFLIGSDQHYLDVNPAGAQLFSYRREELLGMRLSDVVAGSELTRLDDEVRNILAGVAHRGEWLHRRRDGSEFLADVTARRLD